MKSIFNAVSRFVYVFINITHFEGMKQGDNREIYDLPSIAGEPEVNKISSEPNGINLKYRPKRTLTRYRINGKILKYVLSNPNCKPLHLSASSALNSKMLTKLVTSPYGIIMLTVKDESRYAQEKPQIKANLPPHVNRMEESNSEIDGKFGNYRNVIRRIQRNKNYDGNHKNEYFLRFRRDGRKLVIICAKSPRS